jgi:hypothetical protein
VSGPRAVRIQETVPGLNSATFAVTITNTGPVAVRLGEVHLAFAVRRNDVELSCSAQSGDRANYVDTLAPGESFTATANLGCWTPIVGEYVVSVFAAFDSDGGGGARGDAVGEVGLEILDPSGRAAHEAPTHSGLFALAGGAIRTPPVGVLEAGDGGYHLAIALVNAGKSPLELQAARVSLRVYAAGAATPCASQTDAIPIPRLTSGAVHVLHVPVTCVRDRTGDYVVVAHLAFEGEAEGAGFDVGPVAVRVTRDLDVLIPRW